MSKKTIIILSLLIILLPIPAYSSNDFDFSTEFWINNNSLSLWQVEQDNYQNLAEQITGDINFFRDDKTSYQISILDDKFHLGYITETEETIMIDESTAKLIVEFESDNQDYQQQEFNVSFSSLNQKLEGIIIGGELVDRDDLSLILNAKLLQGIELTQRNYEGKVVQEEGEYYFTGLRDGFYSKLNNRETEFYSPDFTSSGYSLGFNIHWQINQNYNLGLKAENIYSEINWEDLYTLTMAYENSGLGFYNNDLPSGSQGNYFYSDYATHLTPDYDLSLSTNQLDLGLVYHNQLKSYLYYQLLENPISIKTGLYSNFFVISLDHQMIDFKLMTPELNLKETEGLGLELSFNFNF